MTRRIPHIDSPTEVRQAFQYLTFQTDIITTGTSGYILVAQGVDVAPVWQTIVSTIDHGSIGGLGDDDHTQYILVTGVRAFTGTVGGVTPVVDADLATKAYVDGAGVTNHGALSGLSDDDHTQYHNDTRGDARYYTETELNAGQLDNRYFTEAEHLDSSAGVGDAGKPIKLDANGHLDATMLNDADVDHGTIGGLSDDDHTQYLLANGSRDLTGNLAVDALITIDGRDISVDGSALDTTIAIQGMVGVDSGAIPGYLGAAANDGVLRTSTGISYADGGNFVTLTTNDGEIVHDNLSGYDANKHVDHTGVSISTSTGLTGGGDISSTRTLSLSHLGIQSLSDPGGDRIMFWDDVGAAAVTWLTVSTGLQISTTNITTKDSEIVHDNLSGYDANKHVDHTGVTLTAGSGIAGGGDISTGRSFDLDINSLSAASIAAGDFVPFWDITATATNKKITFANFEGTLDHGSLAGLDDADHDAVYYQESEHLSVSAGAGDSGKPIVLDADGEIDASMLAKSLGASLGAEWEDMGTLSGQVLVDDICYIGNGIAVAGTGNGGKIFRSVDYGRTWVDLGQQYSQTRILCFVYLGGGIVLAGTYPHGKILRSTDYGATWSDLGQQYSQAWILCLADLGSGVVLAGTSTGGKILRSTDYGANWTDLGQQFSEAHVDTVLGLGGNIALATTGLTGKILRSTDNGINWSDLGAWHSQTRIYTLSDFGDGVVIAGTYPHGKILRSTDYGVNWSDIGQQASQTWVLSLCFVGEGIGYAGTYPNAKILKTINNGVSWTDIGSQYSQQYILALAYVTGGIALAGTGAQYGKILRTSTGLDSEIIGDHGILTGLADDDHTQYLLADGSRDLTGNMSVDAAITIDGRDISVDGTALDTLVTNAGKIKVDTGATADYLGAASNDGVLRTGATIGYTDGGDYVTLALSHLGIESLSDPGADRILFWDNGGSATGWLTVSTGLQISTTNLTTKDSEIVHDNLSGYDAAKHVTLPGTIANVLSDHNLVAHTALNLPEIINSNTTYYITMTGNDSTGDGSSGNPWLTLDKALTYLSTRLIAPAATVTIEIDDGYYEWSSTDTLNHINGDKINIVGKNTYDLTLSSIVSSGGAAAAWSIVLQVGANEADNAAVNDFLLIPYNVTGGTRPETLCGCWIITNADTVNHRLTITSTHRWATAPSGAVSGTITLIKTILEYDGCDGISVSAKCSLGLINKLVLRGTGTNTGLVVASLGQIAGGTSLGISYFLTGAMALGGATLEAHYIKISSCAYQNLRNYYAKIFASYAVFSGSANYGCNNLSGTSSIEYSVVSGNINGILADYNAVTNSYGQKIQYNTGTGVTATNCTFISAETATINNNTVADASPAVNNEGNILSYIKA